MSTNYVKFIRGSADAFNKLATKDSNTLYFITGDDSLKLYLGNTLIGSSSDIKVSTLEDLSNVTVSSLLNQDILMYNGKEWINTSLKDYRTLLDIPTIEDFPIMVGAKNTIGDIPGEDGKSGLVPVPKTGEADFFLKGDGKWTSLSPVIAGEIDKLLENAPEALNTLQEIVDWISDPNNIEPTALINRVGNLEKELEKIGKLDDIPTGKTVVSMVNSHESVLANLDNNYLTISNFESRVGKLNNTNAVLTKLKTENTDSLVEAINELCDQLTWGEINIE